MLQQDLEYNINGILEHHGLQGFKCKILVDKDYFVIHKDLIYIFIYKDVESMFIYEGENFNKKEIKEIYLYEKNYKFPFSNYGKILKSII